MLSSVLRSDRAVRVNIEIMRAFVRLRRILESHADLARKLDALERKYDAQLRVVFDAIRELMAPSGAPRRPVLRGLTALQDSHPRLQVKEPSVNLAELLVDLAAEALDLFVQGAESFGDHLDV